MNRILCFLFLLASANACQNNTAAAPAPSPAPVAQADPQKEVLDVVKKLVEKELTVPVSLRADQFKALDDYAYVEATMLQPDGRKMDYTNTPLKESAEAGGNSDVVCALLQKQNSGWDVLAIAVGPMDVPSICWWKQYGAPQAVFPTGRTAEQCEVEAPVVYVDNDGRIYINGGIGLNFEEMKIALVKALKRMEKTPDHVETQFGDEVLMGTRHEVQTLIKEALDEVKSAKK